ncbi:MAG: hypothetical protein QW474_03420 [Candidatus Aenigmatarchaeota archaeon]
MCQQIVGKVISVDKDKAKVEIKGKIYDMFNPFTKIEKGDMVICAANYIIEKADETVCFIANKK